ncbi:MAG: hypothetical protein WC859_07675 [Elusimicrobiota bacterium]
MNARKIFVLLLFEAAFSLQAASPVLSSTAVQASTTSVAHYAYPPPSNASRWWQKTVRVIRYWAEAFGSGARPQPVTASDNTGPSPHPSK